MDIGTILEGEEAVEEGLIDEVGTVSDAIAALYDLIKKTKGASQSLQNHAQKSRKNNFGRFARIHIYCDACDLYEILLYEILIMPTHTAFQRTNNKEDL
mgnify:CR=1 FL=1